jgi:hypothetical protein
VAAITAPLCAQLLRREGGAPLAMENRTPAQMPELSWSWRALTTFPGRFQAYCDDNFGLRAELLRLHAAAKFHLFGVSPASTVIVGKEGWLFCSADRSAEVWRGLYPFAPDEIDGWLDVLEQRQRWLAERGIAYVFAIAPNKEDIYPELMPDSLNRVGPTRLDELLARASQRGAVEVVDLRPALLAEKQHDGGGDPLYYPGDTHWSWHGAWAASNALLAELQGRFPALEPVGREELVPRMQPFICGDLDREVGRLSPLQSLPQPCLVQPRARGRRRWRDEARSALRRG